MTDRRRFVDHPLFQLSLVRYREFVREPEAVFWVFVFPVLLAAGLGIAFRNRPAEQTRIVVVENAGQERGVVERLRSDSTLVVSVVDATAARDSLRNGSAVLAVAPDGQGGVRYRFDDTNPESRTARLLVDNVLQRASGRTDAVAVKEELVRERGSRYIDFVVPGLLGMNLMGSGIWGVGFAIVDARRKRLLKRFVATPMSRAGYLASFILSRLAFLVIEVAAVLGFAALVFGVPMRGSLVALVALCALSSLAFTSIGLLIASRAQTLEGASGLMNLAMLPMWVLSGVFFSSARFPDVVQPVIKALPLTAVVDALRANMLRGAGFGALGLELAIIGGWLVVSFVLALKLFRWR